MSNNKLILVGRALHLAKERYLDEMIEDGENGVEKTSKDHGFDSGYLEALVEAERIVWRTLILIDVKGDQE